MPKPDAQRQPTPRSSSSGKGRDRVTIWVDQGVADSLRMVARHHGISQREMLDRMVEEEEERRVCEGLTEEEIEHLRRPPAPVRPGK